MITSVRYTNESETQIFVTTDSGTFHSMYWPNTTKKGTYVQSWIDEGNTIEPYQQDLEEAQDEKIIVITTNYDLAELQPVAYDNRSYDAHQDAMIECGSVATSILGGYSVPAGFTWIDKNGNEVVFTDADISGLFLKISKKHYLDMRNYARLKKQVLGASSIDEINAIPDW